MISITFSVLAFFVYGNHCENIKVTVKLGSIHGYKENIDGNEVNAFLGIPFARPPIGDLRFRKPQPIVDKWSEHIDATNRANICMQDNLYTQPDEKVSEDCLYLNIWTPVGLQGDFSQNLKQVMVFIHGGAFTYFGSSNKHYNGSILSSFGDVVIVTMNYRLGAFGFLSLANDDAPGNVGLYDQALALEWVQENIAYFGGDPNKVTLFGESAGAMSVSLHMSSPFSQNTFNRAIIMSGAIFRGIAIDSKEDAVQKAIELSKLLGCTVEEGEEYMNSTLLECLRRASAGRIVELQTSPQLLPLSKSLTKLWFVPIFGEAFVPKEPKEMLQQMSFHPGIDVLVGVLANEGYIIHFFFDGCGFSPKVDNWHQRLRSYIAQYFKDLPAAEIDKVIKFYFNGIDNKNSDEAKMAYYTAIGDVYVNCETVYFSEVVSKVNNLYQYLFDYNIANVNDFLLPCDLHKACHANEIPITFGTVSDPKDIEVSKRWMKIMTDFAKNGTVGWPKHEKDSSPYYDFTGNEESDRLLHSLRSDACKLWRPILEKHY